MSASTPYETKPLRPPALFTLYAMISFYINAKLFQCMKRAYIQDSGPFLRNPNSVTKYITKLDKTYKTWGNV